VPSKQEAIANGEEEVDQRLQFDQFDPTLSVSIEQSGETSQCLCCGTVWYLSEISTRCWTFCRQHQPSR